MWTVFATPAILALVGVAATTSEAITSREELQDASDSAAFSGATTMADGMNMTSLVNLTSASLGSLVTSIDSQFLLVAASQALSEALAPETEGWSLGALGPLAATFGVDMAFEAAAGIPGRAMIKAGHAAQVALRQQAADVGLNLGGVASAAQIAGSTVSNFAAATRLPTFNADPKEYIRRGFNYAVSQSIPRFRMDYLSKGGATWSFVNELAAASGQGLVRAASNLFVQNVAASGELQTLTSDAKMGGEPFQLRYVVERPAQDERGFQLARSLRFNRFGQVRTGDMGVSQAKSLLQRVGFTQAEAYFQGSSDPDDYLYFMRWKARLRRFQGAAGGGAGGLVQQALGSSANRLIFH